MCSHVSPNDTLEWQTNDKYAKISWTWHWMHELLCWCASYKIWTWWPVGRVMSSKLNHHQRLFSTSYVCTLLSTKELLYFFSMCWLEIFWLITRLWHTFPTNLCMASERGCQAWAEEWTKNHSVCNYLANGTLHAFHCFPYHLLYPIALVVYR